MTLVNQRELRENLEFMDVVAAKISDFSPTMTLFGVVSCGYGYPSLFVWLNADERIRQ